MYSIYVSTSKMKKKFHFFFYTVKLVHLADTYIRGYAI